MKTYHIITIGCQMNKSDSERLAAVLERQGLKKTDKKYRADLVIINTCGVRQSAEDRVYGFVPRIRQENPRVKIIITGCLAARQDVKKRLKGQVDDWLMIKEIAKIKSNKIPLTPFDKGGECRNDYLKIEPKYDSKTSAFVPIGNGCNNFCSYCVVPFARGREVWRPAEEIMAEVKNLARRGYKEITLIAQNVNSYKSGKTDFADLLKMADGVKGDFKIKFATSHPKDMSAKLIKTAAECGKVLKEFHLPAQSGDNVILKKMNRKYTAGGYEKIIKKIRALMPAARISTDIIVGFPGETKKQFNNTVRLFKKVKFDKAYIARYSPRPGTAAFRLKDDVSPEEKKRRWLILEKLVNNYGR